MRVGAEETDCPRKRRNLSIVGERMLHLMFGGEEYPENPDYNADDAFRTVELKTRLNLSRLDEHAIDYDLIEQLLVFLDAE